MKGQNCVDIIVRSLRVKLYEDLALPGSQRTVHYPVTDGNKILGKYNAHIEFINYYELNTYITVPKHFTHMDIQAGAALKVAH